MISYLNNYSSRSNRNNTFKSQNSKIVTLKEPKTKILKDAVFFAAELATIKVANCGFNGLKKMTPLEIIGASVLTIALAFMKSGGINPKHEITIKDNKDEKEKIKKSLIKNTILETFLVPTLVLLGCMITGKKENIKKNLKETLICTGIISGLNFLFSGLINMSMYNKYNKSL